MPKNHLRAAPLYDFQHPLNGRRAVCGPARQHPQIGQHLGFTGPVRVAAEDRHPAVRAGLHGLRENIAGGLARGGFAYADDVATARIEAAESPATIGRAYNLCDETNATWREYTDALADALGYDRPRLALPFSAALALARAMEFPYRLLNRRALTLGGRPLLTRHAV